MPWKTKIMSGISNTSNVRKCATSITIMSSDLSHKIGQFIVSKKTELLDHLDQSETELLISLGFESMLNLSRDRPENSALFGYGKLFSDYIPLDADGTIIEVKYIRPTVQDGQIRYNEYDIKNGLSQIIEQAVCKDAHNAVFVIIDAGRGKKREWDEREKKFVNLFISNSFNINLTVVRVIVDCESKSVTYSVIKQE